MKRISLLILVLTALVINACKKSETIPPPITQQPSITSVEYQDKLLLVNKPDFQIQTSEPAEFSSTDPLIKITASGLVSRITSAEVVPIDITWKNSGTKSRIYALGATDEYFDNPYAKYHSAIGTDTYNSYKKGWETLQKLPSTTETYVIVLRHADADKGIDYSVNHSDDGPAEWWKSCDTALARQLNQQGIERATELGRIFQDLKYPLEHLVSSEFCRSVKTAELINTGLPIIKDGRINHPAYNKSGLGLFPGMIEIVKDFPTDQKMSLLVSHHPINELRKVDYPTFPSVTPYSWTGGYFVKKSANNVITYEGAASWGMFKYWRDLKLNRL